MARKIIAFVFALIFICTAFVFTVLMISFNVFADRDTYGSEFVKIVYDYSLDKAAMDVDLSQFPTLDPVSFKNILAEVITYEDVNVLIDSLFNEFKELEVTEDGFLDIHIPLTFFSGKSDAFAGELTDHFYKTLPECKYDLSIYEEVGSLDFSCLAEDIAKADFESELKKALDREIFSSLPDDFVFSLQVPLDSSSDLIQILVDMIFWIRILLISLLVILLIVIGTLIFKPWYDVLHWESKTLFFASLVLVLFFMTVNFVPRLFGIFQEYGGEDLDVRRYEFITDLYNYFVSCCYQKVFYILIPILIVSLGVWIFTVIYRRKKLSSPESQINDTP